MPDRDFTIKIVTTADTSGFKELSEEADKAKAKMSEPLVPFGGGHAGSIGLPGRAARAATASAELTTDEKKVAIETQLQTIAGTRLAMIEAEAAGNEAQVSILKQELAIRTAILGIMRTGVVTQADMVAATTAEEAALASVSAVQTEVAGSGILMGANLSRARQEATVLAREIATGAPPTRTLGSLLGALGIPITATGLALGGVFLGINKAIQAQQKLNDEFAQGLDRVQALARGLQESVTTAVSPEEVTKVAQQGTKAIEEETKKVNELQNQGITGFKAIIDNITSNLVPAGSAIAALFGLHDAWEPFKAGAQKAVDAAASVQGAMQSTANTALKTAVAVEEAFNANKVKAFGDAVKESVSNINLLTTQQQQLNRNAPDFADQYAKLAVRIKDNVTVLKALSDEEQKRHEFVVANLSTEETEQQKLNDEFSHTQELLRGLGVVANTPAEAFEAGVRAGGALGAIIEKLATQWAKLNSEAAKYGDEQVKQTAQDLRVPQEQKFKELWNKNLDDQAARSERYRELEGDRSERANAERAELERQSRLEPLQDELELRRRSAAEQEEMKNLVGTTPEEQFGTEGWVRYKENLERIREILQEINSLKAPKAPEQPEQPQQPQQPQQPAQQQQQQALNNLSKMPSQLDAVVGELKKLNAQFA